MSFHIKINRKWISWNDATIKLTRNLWIMLSSNLNTQTQPGVSLYLILRAFPLFLCLFFFFLFALAEETSAAKDAVFFLVWFSGNRRFSTEVKGGRLARMWSVRRSRSIRKSVAWRWIGNIRISRSWLRWLATVLVVARSVIGLCWIIATWMWLEALSLKKKTNSGRDTVFVFLICK